MDAASRKTWSFFLSFLGFGFSTRELAPFSGDSLETITEETPPFNITITEVYLVWLIVPLGIVSKIITTQNLEGNPISLPELVQKEVTYKYASLEPFFKRFRLLLILLGGIILITTVVIIMENSAKQEAEEDLEAHFDKIQLKMQEKAAQLEIGDTIRFSLTDDRAYKGQILGELVEKSKNELVFNALEKRWKTIFTTEKISDEKKEIFQSIFERHLDSLSVLTFSNYTFQEKITDVQNGVTLYEIPIVSLHGYIFWEDNESITEVLGTDLETYYFQIEEMERILEEL